MSLTARVVSLALVLATPAVASAHIHMLSPTPRYPEDSQKQGPCGVAGGAQGAPVKVVEAGSTLRVEWEETVDHASHYRISLDPDGDDDFVDPPSIDARNSSPTVLLDGIADGASPHVLDVPMPDIECEHCTLQLIQVMYDHGAYQAGTDDIYYACADIALRRSGSGSGVGDAGVECDGSFCQEPASGQDGGGSGDDLGPPTSMGQMPGADGGSGSEVTNAGAEGGAASSDTTGMCAVRGPRTARFGLPLFSLLACALTLARRRRSARA